MRSTAPQEDTDTTGLVLVAEDDPALRVLARTALEEDGHTVAIAEDGEEACRVFADLVPDLVLLDVGRPLLDGYDACARLRRCTGGAHTPILMITGTEDAQSVARAYDVGATDFYAKPVNWRVLRERVKYMLRAKRDADELLKLAHYDILTGLPNRMTFRTQLQQGLRLAEEQARLLAVIFLDLDGFKEINDTFGHGFGDQVLKRVAGRLIHSLRATDTLGRVRRPSSTLVAGRFGGDEFTVCATDIQDVAAATVVALSSSRCLACSRSRQADMPKPPRKPSSGHSRRRRPVHVTTPV